ncbi:hypothetical protein [Shimia ponticola]|nr:hypothetical protein [Shimia ponticola]
MEWPELSTRILLVSGVIEFVVIVLLSRLLPKRRRKLYWRIWQKLRRRVD